MIDLDELRASLPTAGLRTAERVVEVTGADRLTYLDATTSQSLAARQPGEAVGALVLDAHGLALAVLEVLVLEDRVLLVVPDDAVAATVLEILGGRTFLSDARFTLTDLEVLRVFGPAAQNAGQAVLGDDRSAVTTDRQTQPLRQAVWTSDAFVVAIDASGSLRVIAAAASLDAVARRLEAQGVIAGDEAGLETWRVVNGVPAWGREIVPPHLPEELGLLPTHVHLAKGCYPGQETVARMWMLGRPRRRLAVVGAHPDGSSGAREGQVTFERVASYSVEFGLGLALVPNAMKIGDRARAGSWQSGDHGWIVVDVPGDGLVPPGHDPGMRRRRDR